MVALAPVRDAVSAQPSGPGQRWPAPTIASRANSAFPLWQDRQNAQTTRRFSRYDRVPSGDLPAGVSLADALTADPRTLRVTQG
jgi:hypothetical protein